MLPWRCCETEIYSLLWTHWEEISTVCIRSPDRAHCPCKVVNSVLLFSSIFQSNSVQWLGNHLANKHYLQGVKGSCFSKEDIGNSVVCLHQVPLMFYEGDNAVAVRRHAAGGLFHPSRWQGSWRHWGSPSPSTGHLPGDSWGWAGQKAWEWAWLSRAHGWAGLWGAGAWPHCGLAGHGLAVEADMFLLLARDPLASFLKHPFLRKTITLLSCPHGIAVSQARYAKRGTSQNEQKCLTLQSIKRTLAG